MADYLSGLSGLADLYGQYQSYQNANSTANNMGGISSAANSAWQNQLQALQNQIATGRNTAAGDYETASTYVQDFLNPRLMGNIDSMTGQLNSLNDPNSAYMQMARQAIERKDAASGRRSQWGDREVQLAGNLAQQYNQYAPGLQNAITATANQVNTNNQGLANIYNNYSQSGDRNNASLTSLINGANGLIGQQAQIAASANNANNQQNGLIGAGIKAIPGIVSGISSWFGNSGGQDSDPLGDFGSSEGWW